MASRRVGTSRRARRRHLHDRRGRRRRGLHPVQRGDRPRLLLGGRRHLRLGGRARAAASAATPCARSIAWLIDVRGHHRLTVDPAAANARAIHVYEKLGFRPRRRAAASTSASPDGAWRDALLMELLADGVRARRDPCRARQRSAGPAPGAIASARVRRQKRRQRRVFHLELRFMRPGTAARCS